MHRVVFANGYAVLWVGLLIVGAGCIQSTDGTPAAQSSSKPPSTLTRSSTPASNASGDAASNNPPTGEITASVTSGPAPLDVTFTIAATDADGDDLTWSLADSSTTLATGTGGNGTYEHTFDVGTHTITLTVSDGEANATANVTVSAVAPTASKVGLPKPDGKVKGSVYAYNSVGGQGVGVSNVASTATGAAGDPVPKYPAGSDVVITARSVSADGVTIAAATPCEFSMRKPDGSLVLGPLKCTGSADSSALQYTVGVQKLPATKGTYLLVFGLTVDGTTHYITDDSTKSDGLRKIEII